MRRICFCGRIRKPADTGLENISATWYKSEGPLRVAGVYGSSFYLVNTGNKKSTGLRFMCVAQSAVDDYVPVVWPSEGHNVNESSDSQSTFGWRKFDGRAIEFHEGADIRKYNSNGENIGEGTPVRAVAAGKAYTTKSTSGYGNHVIIEHDIPGKGRYCTLYAHMLEDGLIADGAEVKAGEPIGKLGSSGRSSGPHLHFAFWRGSIDDYQTEGINPTNLYAHRDTRTTSSNPQPLFKKTGSTYAYNPSFDWNYSSNPLPARYSHSTAYQN